MISFAKFLLLWTAFSIALGLIVGPLLAELSASVSVPPDLAIRPDRPSTPIQYVDRSAR